VLEIATLTPGLGTRSAGRRETDIGLSGKPSAMTQDFARWPVGPMALYRTGSSNGMKFVSIGIFSIAGDSAITNV